MSPWPRDTVGDDSAVALAEVSASSQDAGAFSSGKLSGFLHLQAALRHNLREIAAERGSYGNIDSKRTINNYALHGPDTSTAAMGIAKGIVSTADTEGKALRKDAVVGIELIFTALPKTKGDLVEYFADCTRWAEAEFKAPLLSSVAHLDESSPHCHVILIPLVKGKMNGARLYGGKTQMSARLSSFYETVGKRYGLTRPEVRVKHPLGQRMLLLQRCADVLAKTMLPGKQIQALLKPHKADPLPLARSFGVVFRGARAEPGSFIDLMTA
ncbi:plasmid recombination protein [Massilia aurea]|uniref:plasmid recombination protein n=1 Tax=Massilia aurea TaxID=373040 RepID=UPI003462AB8F